MKSTYKVTGMTCENCVASVNKYINKLETVNSVDINLSENKAVIESDEHLSISELKNALPEKYTIEEMNSNSNSINKSNAIDKKKSKWSELKPLFLILFYITTATLLMNYKIGNWQDYMLDFMGLFYIVFSFFKMLDLKGFPESFRMYDPLAKKLPIYGKVYPFIETALGLMFLFRFQIEFALIATIVILGITTYGVTRSLLDKRVIRCACLGTALNLPMTEATFIENAIMLVMASAMLISMINL